MASALSNAVYLLAMRSATEQSDSGHVVLLLLVFAAPFNTVGFAIAVTRRGIPARSSSEGLLSRASILLSVRFNAERLWLSALWLSLLPGQLPGLLEVEGRTLMLAAVAACFGPFLGRVAVELAGGGLAIVGTLLALRAPSAADRQRAAATL